MRYLSWLTLTSPPLRSKAHFSSNCNAKTYKNWPERNREWKILGSGVQPSGRVLLYKTCTKSWVQPPHYNKTKLTFINLWFNHAKCDGSKVYDQITPSKIIKNLLHYKKVKTHKITYSLFLFPHSGSRLVGKVLLTVVRWPVNEAHWRRALVRSKLDSDQTTPLQFRPTSWSGFQF